MPKAKTLQAGRISSNSMSISTDSSSQHSKDCQAPCPELPIALICSILAFVPLKQQLAVCTRVSNACKAAVTAVTKDISLLKHPKDDASFDSWLVACGHQLTSLQLAQGKTAFYNLYCKRLSLPCASLSGLQRLTLDGYDFQLCCTAISTRSTPARSKVIIGRCPSPGPLPGLKQLNLLRANLTLGTLKGFFPLRGLTCLSMSQSYTRADGAELTGVVDEKWADDMADWLKQLADLQSLTLQYLFGPVHPAVVDTLSTLKQLQHLDLDQHFDSYHDEEDGEVDIGCPYLAHSLTSLALAGACVKVSPNTAPGFSKLTALQGLRLSKGAQLDPSMLASVPQLRTLELDFCILLLLRAARRQQGTTVYTFDLGDADSTTETKAEFEAACVGVAELFKQLPSLTRLESLTLSHIWGLKEQPLQSFEALTASSHLTALCFEVQEVSWSSDRMSPEGKAIGNVFYMPLPLGTLQHMFPAGKQLPQLWLLRIAYTGATIEGMYGDLEQEDIQRPKPLKVTARERAAIKAACPALKDLQIQLT